MPSSCPRLGRRRRSRSSLLVGFETGISRESVQWANSVSLARFNSVRGRLRRGAGPELVGKSFVSKIYILGFHFFAKIECGLSGLSRLFLSAQISSTRALLLSVLCFHLFLVLSSVRNPPSRTTCLACSIRDGSAKKELRRSKDMGRILRLIEFNFKWRDGCGRQAGREGREEGQREEEKEVDL